MSDSDSGYGGWKDWLRSKVTPANGSKPLAGVGQKFSDLGATVDKWATDKTQNSTYGRAMQKMNDAGESAVAGAIKPAEDALRQKQVESANRAARLQFASQPAAAPQDKRNAVPAPEPKNEEAALDAEAERDRLAYDAAHSQTVHQSARPGMMRTSPQAKSPQELMSHAREMLDSQASQHQAQLEAGPAVGPSTGSVPEWLRKEQEGR